MDTNSLMNRLMRVFRFDATVYREVAADLNALPQALTVVVIAIVIGGIGAIGGAAQFGGGSASSI